METARLRTGSREGFPAGIGKLLLQFLGGMGTMIVAGILSGFVGGYVISLFWAGPHLPWQPIDKNIGLESAIRAIIAGDLLAMAGLAWFSSHRGHWMPLWGGFTIFALELGLAFYGRDGVGVGLGTVALASLLGAFVIGVVGAHIFRQLGSGHL
jgi:hypothetical protein